MKCRCGKKATIQLSYVDRQYCDKCFLHYLEQRVRKDIRMNKDIEPLDELKLLNEGTKEHFLAKHFLKSIFGKNISFSKKGKEVLPANMERVISEKLRFFLENKHKEYYQVLILDNVLEEEMVQACRILGKEAKEEEEVNTLIKKMEEKYPDTKFSLYKAFEKLEQELS